MKDEIKKLLVVLDLSEKEQERAIARHFQSEPYGHTFSEIHKDKPSPRWLIKCRKCTNTWEFVGFNIQQLLEEESKIRFTCPYPDPLSESLADLAFRLRDEVMKKHRPEWLAACKLIYLHLCPQIQYCSLLQGERFILEQSPIHWITAVSIAKKLAKER